LQLIHFSIRAAPNLVASRRFLHWRRARGQILVKQPSRTVAADDEADAINPRHCSSQRTVATGGDDHRPNRTQEVAGSSPASSISGRPAKPGFSFSEETTEAVENRPWSRFGQVALQAI
jgi:hypothetical protein